MVGVRRSLAVADYLVYNLQHTNQLIHLVPGLGGRYREQLRSIHANDLIIAISFSPYGKESQHRVRIAQNNGAKSLIIIDSPLSPVAKLTNTRLLADESCALAFRSLIATLCLCHTRFSSHCPIALNSRWTRLRNRRSWIIE